MIALSVAGERELSVGSLQVHPSCLDVACLCTFPALAQPFAHCTICISHAACHTYELIIRPQLAHLYAGADTYIRS